MDQCVQEQAGMVPLPACLFISIRNVCKILSQPYTYMVYTGNDGESVTVYNNIVIMFLNWPQTSVHPFTIICTTHDTILNWSFYF